MTRSWSSALRRKKRRLAASFCRTAPRRKPRQGKVVSLGDGKRLESGKRAAFQVREGDRVLFSSYAGNEVTVGSEELLIMTEDDILAVVD